MASANEHDAQMSFLPTLCSLGVKSHVKHFLSLKHCRASKIKISLFFIMSKLEQNTYSNPNLHYYMI